MPAPLPNVKAVFGHAAEIDAPAGRESYLAEACEGHPEVRREIDSLLRALDDAGSFLEAGTAAEPHDTTAATLVAGSNSDGWPMSPLDPTADAPAAIRSRMPDGQAGTVIADKYTLVEVIGEGGMGSVWRARQTEPVKRSVAVKLIKAGMDSRQVLARFEAERQALALMDHPNIARVLDGGLHDGRPYFVMELVRGVPITEFCDARRLTPRERLELFVPVCQAIQHAHQKGVIHRDIKPSNVLVALYDDHPVPKVIDFGVAKAAGATLTEHTIDTGFGGVVGTPQYMSPEQATLNNIDIDTRSDVYSLGVLLYELLTGSPPFSRKELERKGVLEILRVVREEDPPRPSTKLSTADALPTLSANRGTEPRALTGLLRSELDWVVMKALEKDRSRRYETANAFAADVRRYLDGEAVQAHPPGAVYRLRKFASRNKGRVVAASLVLMALVAGMAGTTVGLVRATQAADAERRAKLRESERAEGERLARLEAQESADEEKKAKEEVEAVLGFVEEKVFAAARPKGQHGGLGYDVKLGDAIEAALPAIEKGFPGKPLTEARLRRTIGISFNYLGKADLAAWQLEAARSLFRRHRGPDHHDTLMSMSYLANSYASLGRIAEALKLREQALAICKARLGRDHHDTLMSMNNLALSYADSGRAADAIRLHEETLAIRKAKLGPDHPDTLASMSNLSNCYGEVGRAAEALRLREQALAYWETMRGPDDPLTLMSMNNLALSYGDVGRGAEAIKLHEETLSLMKATLGPYHPDTLRSMNNLANSYLAGGRTREAMPHLEQRSIAEPKGTLLSMRVAALHAWFGQGRELAATRRRVLANAEGTDDPFTADRAARVCSLLPPAGRAELDAAMDLGRRAVDLGKNSDWMDFFLLSRGMAEYRGGRFAEAEASLAAAVDFGKGHPHVNRGMTDLAAGTSAFYRAMSLHRRGKRDEARALATEAIATMKPLPIDERNPLVGASVDDLFLWLAYKEAKELIGLPDPTAAPALPAAK